jgi:hypothetical protein
MNNKRKMKKKKKTLSLRKKRILWAPFNSSAGRVEDCSKEFFKWGVFSRWKGYKRHYYLIN